MQGALAVDHLLTPLLFSPATAPGAYYSTGIDPVDGVRPLPSGGA